jgi:hypothetical protein
LGKKKPAQHGVERVLKELHGAGSRNRTDTPFQARDFESIGKTSQIKELSQISFHKRLKSSLIKPSIGVGGRFLRNKNPDLYGINHAFLTPQDV